MFKKDTVPLEKYNRGSTSLYFRGTQGKSSHIPLFLINEHDETDQVCQFPYLTERPSYDTAVRFFTERGYGTAVHMRLRGKKYIIGFGFILEIISQYVYRPLLITTMDTAEDLKYYRVTMLHSNRATDTEGFSIWIHPDFERVDSPWRGAKELYRKHLKQGLKGFRVRKTDPEALFLRPEIPSFAIETKKRTIRRDVIAAFTHEWN